MLVTREQATTWKPEEEARSTGGTGSLQSGGQHDGWMQEVGLWTTGLGAAGNLGAVGRGFWWKAMKGKQHLRAEQS